MSWTPWWALPRYPYRPQLLKLALLLQERTPAADARQAPSAMAATVWLEAPSSDQSTN